MDEPHHHIDIWLQFGDASFQVVRVPNIVVIKEGKIGFFVGKRFIPQMFLKKVVDGGIQVPTIVVRIFVSNQGGFSFD